MKLTTRHITTSEALRGLANAEDIAAARDLLKVIEIERDHIRSEIEIKPEDPQANIKLAKINILNWILDVPKSAREYIEKQSEGE